MIVIAKNLDGFRKIILQSQIWLEIDSLKLNL